MTKSSKGPRERPVKKPKPHKRPNNRRKTMDVGIKICNCKVPIPFAKDFYPLQKVPV